MTFSSADVAIFALTLSGISSRVPKLDFQWLVLEDLASHPFKPFLCLLNVDELDEHERIVAVLFGLNDDLLDLTILRELFMKIFSQKFLILPGVDVRDKELGRFLRRWIPIVGIISFGTARSASVPASGPALEFLHINNCWINK